MNLNKHLENIQEQGFADEIKEEALKMFIVTIITLLMYFVLLYYSTKKDKNLSDKVYKITGRRFDVKIIKEKSPNGFCFGGFGNDIYLTTGLMSMLNEREIIAVCLHECGHIISYDTVQNFMVQLGATGASILLLEKLSSQAKKMKNNKLGLFLFGLLAIILLVFIKNGPTIMWGRVQEYKADKEAAKYGYGKDLASALEKFEDWIQKHMIKDSAYMRIMYKITMFLDVHPQTKDRVERVLEEAQFYKLLMEKKKDRLIAFVKDKFEEFKK